MSITKWLVESRVNGKHDGYFTAPDIGMGGWWTADPKQAMAYSFEAAKAVAHALTYFHAPFNYSNWIATEHVFLEE